MPCLILAPQYKEVIDKPARVQRRATMVVGCWGTCPVRRGWGISAGSAWRGDGFGGPNSSPPGRVGRRLRQSQHLQGGAWQEEKKAMETDRNQRGSDWTTREDAFIQDSEVVGQVAQRLCNLYPWGLSGPDGLKLWAAWSELTLLCAGGWTRDHLRPLAAHVIQRGILWSLQRNWYRFVILHFTSVILWNSSEKLTDVVVCCAD